MPIERTEAGHWVVSGDILRTPWVKQNRSLEFDFLLPHIAKLIKPGDTVVDVGANIGDHTVAYRRLVSPAGRVVAFEPDPECYACCVLNCGTFEDIHCAAALEAPRDVGMFTASNRGASFVQLEGGGTPGFAIDDLALPRCNLIKIDVEGAELLALQGARATIARHRPVIICELVEDQLARFGNGVTEVKAFIASFGYAGGPLLAGVERDWAFYPG